MLGLDEAKEENHIKQELSEIKDELHVKQELNEIKEEKYMKPEMIDFDTEISEYILHKDADLYENMFSPNSMSESDDEEFNHLWQEVFNDLPEVVQYLKQGIVLH